MSLPATPIAGQTKPFSASTTNSVVELEVTSPQIIINSSGSNSVEVFIDRRTAAETVAVVPSTKVITLFYHLQFNRSQNRIIINSLGLSQHPDSLRLGFSDYGRIMKYEGLSDYELECLKTPVKDLTHESLQVAISAKIR